MRYPLTITNLSGRVAVVVGGGIVGERKVRSLLAADVQVRLISPSATEQLTAWAEGGEIEWKRAALPRRGPGRRRAGLCRHQRARRQP